MGPCYAVALDLHACEDDAPSAAQSVKDSLGIPLGIVQQKYGRIRSSDQIADELEFFVERDIVLPVAAGGEMKCDGKIGMHPETDHGEDGIPRLLD